MLDAVSAACLACSYAALYVFNGGIGLDVAENIVCNICSVQHVGHLLRNTELDQIGVGGNKCLLEAARVDFGNDCGDGTCAVVGGFVEHKFFHSGCSFLYLWILIAVKHII